MNDVTRFGVIKVGKLWTVITDQGDRASFYDRKNAMRAAEEMAEVERGFGKQVELLSQNEMFELRPTDIGALRR
jgi:hypothetical protein